MKKFLAISLFLGILCSITSVSAEGVVAEEPGKWKKAGEEISGAAHAVGDATVDSSKKAWKASKEGSTKALDAGKEGTTKALDAAKEGSAEAWDATKKGSKEAWEAAKEKSKAVWEKGKAKLHEATAPEPAAPKAE
ncbi:MAG TPA: hypothetical protein EYP35_05725 [Desulfobacterales bacterium]|nr:hypothetical protein [Desulfobacterales bacterium]HIP40239.1 hypothetical protein [Desulfocapsa sulfexigens]